MKKWAVLVSAVGLAFAVSGCSSDYVMATKDGRMILTDGKPEVDDDTGLVSYRDQEGNKMQINRDKYRKLSSDNQREVSRLLAFLIFFFPFCFPSAMFIFLCREVPDVVCISNEGSRLCIITVSPTALWK